MKSILNLYQFFSSYRQRVIIIEPHYKQGQINRAQVIITILVYEQIQLLKLSRFLSKSSRNAHGNNNILQ